VTRLGRFLRRTRIDELPQMINIVLGEMSWIGPRPEALVLSEHYEARIPFYRYRHIVYPGISGWAQVNQGHVTQVEDVQEKLHFDFYYIKHFSPWIDALIIARTFRTVFTGFGSR
jgi:lipopolysaccharide/colanic/teichoic acid biosynthesis glycosyltransferase